MPRPGPRREGVLPFPRIPDKELPDPDLHQISKLVDEQWPSRDVSPEPSMHSAASRRDNVYRQGSSHAFRASRTVDSLELPRVTVPDHDIERPLKSPGADLGASRTVPARGLYGMYKTSKKLTSG